MKIMTNFNYVIVFHLSSIFFDSDDRLGFFKIIFNWLKCDITLDTACNPILATINKVCASICFMVWRGGGVVVKCFIMKAFFMAL